MQRLFQELKRRKVFRVATIYAVAAWPLVQLADLFFPAFGLPDQAMTYLLVAFVSGFPLALILSWVFNLTSEGIILEAGEPAPATADESKGDWIIVASLIALMLVLFAIFSTQASFEPIVQSPSIVNAAVKVDENAIAVLPFQIFSTDKNDRYFADGLTDELSNALSRIDGLRVAARTSTSAYLDTGKTIAEIGAELKVGKIIEGTVRHNDVDNRIRVSASLVDVATGTQLWSKSFDREFTDLFRVQEEISEVVAKQMKLKIAKSDEEYAKNIPTSVDAMVAYSAGQSELHKRTIPALKSALTWFRRAVELDPAYAPAHIGVSNAANLLFIYGGSSKTAAKEISEPAIAKAMTINPYSADVYAAQGLLIWRDDASKAADFFKKAIEKNPNYSIAHNWYGGVLRALGQLEEALPHFEMSYKLDPRSTVAAHNVAQSLFDLGRDKDALRLIDELILMDPYYPGAFNLIGNLYLKRGRLDDAVLQFRKSLELAPSNKEGAFGQLKAVLELRDRKLADAALEGIKKFGDMEAGSEWSATIKLMEARKDLVLGDPHLSIEKFDEVIEVLKGTSRYLIVEGEKSYFIGDYGASVEAFRQLDKDSEKIGFNLYSGEEDMAFHYAYALMQTGDEVEAQRVLDRILKEVDKPWRKKRQYPDDFFMLSQMAIVKNKVDEALLYLNLAVSAGWTSTWILEIDPAWAGLLGDERLISLKQRVDSRLVSMRRRLASNMEFTQTSIGTLLH